MRMNRLVVFLGLLSSAAFAQQPSEEDELALAYGDRATISIATGGAQPIARAPAVASVITADDIKAMGATDLDQALESVPGLHVSAVHVAMNPIYSFRGIFTRYNPQVLMLVNGIPITNVFWGDRSQLWGGMPLENVKRIEVIRGPGSALYGADAFSGVINVITKTSADINGTEMGFRGGSYNSGEAWVQHGGQFGGFDSAFYFRAGTSDGQKGIIQSDAQTALDAIFGTRASLAPGPIAAQRKAVDARADLSRGDWRFRAAYQQREVGTGVGVAASLDPNARARSSRIYLDLSYEKAGWAPNWDLSGVAGYYDIQDKPGNPAYVLFPPGAFAGAFPNGMIGNPGHSERHAHASASALYTGFEQHRVRVGSGFRVEDLYQAQEVKNFGPTFAPLPGMVDATGNPALVYLLPHKRNLAYVFVQDEWNITNDWTLTAGVRHDRYSDFGGTTNPRLALVWDAAYNVVIKAMHGEAFRAPSFAELYAINNPVVVGNPNLKPETLASDELAFSWQPTSSLQTSLNFFRYRMGNIILPAATYQNSGGQTGRGLELEATLDVTNNLRMTGSFSLQHSIDSTTGLDAGLAPHRRLFARADYRVAPFWRLGAKVNYVAGRMREPGDPRPLIPDYTTLDLTLKREQFADGWDASAMVMNLFNRDAREPTLKSVSIPYDLPLPGRTFYVQVEHSL